MSMNQTDSEYRFPVQQGSGKMFRWISSTCVALNLHCIMSETSVDVVLGSCH